ncbi:Immunoglobulin superfamily containing leucine-rich repeat protein 2-like [Oopsacas minuta]|uniref:Immunoglobulin superfamily containing leucine-rich repeat protein 2-like n=1 Tax=Oopsacas minuta TaxID=111878 RepID=A0AAV7JYK5_9METZ|nr:Immunoglobulin superfamily containing leucine-rich repeat protein 2-like [Oopsacas minuta]
MATNIFVNNEGQINAMLKSAKKGNWDVVFDILENKPSLVNCISSDKAWGVLHQAAWMNLFPVVKRLIQIPGCDPAIETRRDYARKHGPGKLHVNYPQIMEYSVTSLRQREDQSPFCYLNDDGGSMYCEIRVYTSGLNGLTNNWTQIKLVINVTNRIREIGIDSRLSDYQLEINAYRQFNSIITFTSSSNNHIVSPSVLTSLPNLVHFYMWRGNFYHFPIFSLFNKQLTLLALYSFGIRSNAPVIRSRFVSQLPNLGYLYLYPNNMLVVTENIFSGLTTLKYLYTENLQLRYPIRTLSPLVRLKRLSIRYAGLSEIDFLKQTPSLYQLTSISFWGNNIHSFNTDVFSDYTQLESLELKTNFIAIINRTNVNKLFNLDFLRLGYNQISTVPEDSFRDMPQLRIVALSDNQITTISSKVFEHLSNIERVYLSNNPFHCDCRLEWMSIVSHKYDIDFEDPSCNTPPEHKGKSVLLPSLYTNCTRELSYQCFNKSVKCPRGSYCQDTLHSYECVCEGEGVVFSTSLNSCIDYEKLIQTTKSLCGEYVLDSNGHSNCTPSTNVVTTHAPTCPVQPVTEADKTPTSLPPI